MNNRQFNELIARIQILEEIVLKKKPERIQSPTILTSIVNEYNCTASQASNIKHLIQTGELKNSEEVRAYLEKKLRLISTVKGNKNKGGESS